MLAVARGGEPHPTAVMLRDPAQPTVVPQLADKPATDGRPTAYVCRGFACSAPVHTAEVLRTLIAGPIPS